MVSLAFSETFEIKEWLGAQMELYAEYKKQEDSEKICDAVLTATAAHLEMWHKKILEDKFPKEFNTDTKTIRKMLGLPELPVVKFNEPQNESPCASCPNFGKSTYCQCTLGGPTITC